MEGGLLTPVNPKAENKGVLEISAEMNDLAVRSRARRLQQSEYRVARVRSRICECGVREFAAIIKSETHLFSIETGSTMPFAV
jgi:pyruvate dehydrogenase E2 component (dihydrolipoamide acetyltransferase)